jgi:hypothetical protein
MKLKINHSRLEFREDYSDGLKTHLTSVPKETICGLVLHGTDYGKDYHTFLYEIKSSVHEILGRSVPVTVVPQFLLPDGGLSLEIYYIENDVDIITGGSDGVCYGSITTDGSSVIFIEGIPSSDFSDTPYRQSEGVFEKMGNLLVSNGFTAGDIVRQWNYIGNITGFRDDRQNYQEFNDARSRYYGTSEWKNGYPAATGIGMSNEGIIVGCIAFRQLDGNAAGIYSINNPLQIPAHEYSRSVLVDNTRHAIKSTPKFERAKLTEISGGACCYVSGTAAIRGEGSVEDTSADQQTLLTIENINYLVSKENRSRFSCQSHDLRFIKLHVYVKNAADYKDIKAVVDNAYPDIPTVYTIADVCRSELLVEVEGLLIS